MCLHVTHYLSGQSETFILKISPHRFDFRLDSALHLTTNIDARCSGITGLDCFSLQGHAPPDLLILFPCIYTKSRRSAIPRKAIMALLGAHLAVFLALKMCKADHSHGQAHADAYLPTMPRRPVRRLSTMCHTQKTMRLLGLVYTDGSPFNLLWTNLQISIHLTKLNTAIAECQ